MSPNDDEALVIATTGHPANTAVSNRKHIRLFVDPQ
jgi:hypothetical protein